MKYSPKEERPGRAQRRQTNGRGRCSWGRAGAGGVRKFPDGGELRAEQVIEHLAHGRGHVLHKGFQGRELYTDGRSRASVRHGGLGLAPGRRLGEERGLVHLVRPFHHSACGRVGRMAARLESRLQPLNQPFFFSSPEGAPAFSLASDASSLIRLSIALARLASTALSRTTSKLIFSARPSLTLPSPSRSPSRRRVSCSVVIETPPSRLLLPSIAIESRRADRTMAWRSVRSRTRSRPAESHSSTIETIRRWSPAATAPASSATLASATSP